MPDHVPSHTASLPSVSVVLPVRNGQRFLAEAINSILAQTFHHFELLIIDDGSDDTSRAIAGAYAARDRRVQVIARRRQGLVAALNAGLAAARGSLIARMDADDISHATRLALQVDYLTRHPQCVAVGTGIEIADEHLRRLGRLLPAQEHDVILKALLNGGSGLAHPTTMMRRDAVEAAGGYVEGTFPSEDRDLWFRLSACGQLSNLNECLLVYRRSPDTVEVRDMAERRVSRAAVINRARQERGLPLLAGQRAVSLVLSPQGRYHFGCAATALSHRESRLALHHAVRCVFATHDAVFQHLMRLFSMGSRRLNRAPTPGP